MKKKAMNWKESVAMFMGGIKERKGKGSMS